MGKDNLDSIKFNSFMIKCFQPEEEKFKPTTELVRYHYTSANALLKILTPSDGSAFVRFTDVRYLNDKSEMLFFIKRLLEFVRDNSEKYPYCKQIITSLLLKHHTEQEYIELSVTSVDFASPDSIELSASRNFVFCTSKEKDSLHMWNYYIHNNNYQGYNIGFDIYKFIKSFDVANKGDALDPIFFYYGEVIYNKEQQLKAIKTICDKIEAEKSKNFPEKSMVDLHRYICSYGMFFKDKSFSDEKEYRVLIEISESRVNNDRKNYANKFNQKIRLDFYERNGMIVPCLMVPFDTSAVKRITMAPIMEKGIAQSGVEEFLKVNNFENVEVKPSEIPIRY